MPSPKPNEKESDFISRCVPYVKKEHPDWEQDKCTAVCYSIWRESKKKNNEESDMTSNRVLLHLKASMFKPITINAEEEKIGFDRATILVGDGTFNGLYFPKEELEKAFLSWDKQPINLDHSNKIEDIVGFIKEPFYDKVNHKITVQPIIDEMMPKSPIAVGYINNRLKAGAVPEVSVGVWLDRIDEEFEGKTRLTARNLQGDHLALVTRGACSPEDGCGIGLMENSTITIPHEEYIEKNEEDLIINKLKKEILKEEIMEEEKNR